MRPRIQEEQMTPSAQPWHQQTPIAAAYYFLHKRRRPLAPVYVSLAVGGIGLLGSLFWPARWPLGLLGALPCIAIAFLTTRWWLRRAYLFAAAAACAWICVTLWAGGPRPLLLEVWAGLTAVMAIVWWWHRWASWGRVKTRQAGRAPDRVRAWLRARQLMWHWKRKGLEGDIRSVTCDAHGHTLHLLAPGTVMRDIDVPRWESTMRLERGLMRITEADSKAHRFDVRILERDPLAGVLPYPGGVKGTVRSGVRLGRYEDGRDVHLHIRDTHILIAGVTGAGKSGCVNALLAELAWCDDVELWGGDLKGGMELEPWRDRFTRLEITVARVEEMLDDLKQEIESRTFIQRNRTKGKGKRMWYPTPRDPQIVVVVEEVARLTSPGREMLEEVAMIGRALGVTLICTTQQPSAKILGSTVLRSQLKTRIALRVGEVAEIAMVLDKGMQGQGWRPDRLTQKGSFLIHSEEHLKPTPARSWWVDDGMVEELVEGTRDLRPDRVRALKG
jgi:DNA segregation ATPase FtsK/SpoIIIE, S-DNA-T family